MLFSPYSGTSPSNSSRPNFITFVMKLCTVQSPVTYSLLDPNIFLCNLFSSTINVYFSLNLRDEFSHSHTIEVIPSLYTPWRRVGRAELSLHSFLNSALDGSDGYFHNLGAGSQGKNPRYTLCRSMTCPSLGLGVLKKRVRMEHRIA